MGAGWYGCHLAMSLQNFGLDVSIFEQKNDIFSGASSKNQNRLHLGFHYARDAATREQTKSGFEKFEKTYGFLLEEIGSNIYAIPEIESQICPETYRLTMVSAGLYFDQVDPKEFGIENCKFGFKTREKVINWDEAKVYFKKQLHNELQLSTKIEHIQDQHDAIIVNNEKFDFLIDCSWGQLNLQKSDIFFEPCILLRYDVDPALQDFAVTFVDGSLPSVYPESGLKTATLSSVSHTPLGQFPTWEQAAQCLEKVTSEVIQSKIEKMQSEIKFYYPHFSEYFKFIEPQMSIKTKSFHKSANRQCSVNRNGRVIEVMSGKIDTIFAAQSETLVLMSQKS